MGLAFFDFKENSHLHELCGLACFAMYVLVLLAFFIPKIYLRWGADLPNFSGKENKMQAWAVLPILVVLMLFYMNLFQKENNKLLADNTFGVEKVEESDAVIYRKPISHFYSAEHNPMFCWRGEGYKLINIEIKAWNNKKYYFGKLEKKGQVLHTAWWFSDGKIHTTNQYVWRWQALVNNKAFKLISVTSNSRETLQNLVPVYLDLPQPLIL